MTRAAPQTFSAEAIRAAGGAVVQVWLGHDGIPCAARAAARIAAPPSRVWRVVTDVEGFARHVPMMHRVRREGDRVTVDLRFKLSLFSVGFQFVAEVHSDGDHSLELRGISGEPRGLRLGFEVAPFGEAEPEATLMHTNAEFDPHSVGWLAKYFLRHHPEIQYGMFPGVALSLLDSMRRAAEA